MSESAATSAPSSAPLKLSRGTLVAPFLALVVTLVYYRLSGTAQVPAAPGENYGGFGQTPLRKDPQYGERPAR